MYPARSTNDVRARILGLVLIDFDRLLLTCQMIDVKVCHPAYADDWPYLRLTDTLAHILSRYYQSFFMAALSVLGQVFVLFWEQRNRPTCIARRHFPVGIINFR